MCPNGPCFEFHQTDCRVLNEVAGSLATGQGTRCAGLLRPRVLRFNSLSRRFVLAATEYLHKRIAKMNERIRQLEDALAILQARCSNETHPLLRDDALPSKLEQDEEEEGADVEPAHHADIIDTFGTLSVSDHGVSRFFGPTGGSEVGVIFAWRIGVSLTAFSLPVSSFRMYIVCL